MVFQSFNFPKGSGFFTRALRGLAALCSDAATAEAPDKALTGESLAGKAAAAAHRSTNIRMTALGNHTVHAAIEPIEIEPESAVDASTHAHAQHEPALATAAA